MWFNFSPFIDTAERPSNMLRLNEELVISMSIELAVRFHQILNGIKIGKYANINIIESHHISLTRITILIRKQPGVLSSDYSSHRLQ